MSTREEDIISLCNSVMDMTLDFYDNPNGPYEYTCPLCGAEEDGDIYHAPTMATIKHDLSCGYLIAKDLLT
jgi:hypothetical protein